MQEILIRNAREFTEPSTAITIILFLKSLIWEIINFLW